MSTKNEQQTEALPAIRTLVRVLEERMAGGRGDWDDHMDAWTNLRELADALGLSLAVPLNPEVRP